MAAIKKERNKIDDLIHYLFEIKKEAIKECHEDFKTKEFQEALKKLRERNKSKNVI